LFSQLIYPLTILSTITTSPLAKKPTKTPIRA